MVVSDISKYSGHLIRIYVFALILGVASGLYGGLGIEFNFDSDSAIYEMVWPLGGMIFGMAWFGLGPIPALFAVGTHVAALIKDYINAGGALLVGGGAVSSQLVTSTINMSRGGVEALAFLYGAVAGMYLVMHYAEIFDYGTSIDDTAKRNFLRKSVQAMTLAFVAAGLRAVSG